MLPNDKTLQTHYERIVGDTLLRLLPHDEGLQQMRKSEQTGRVIYATPQPKDIENKLEALNQQLTERLAKAKPLYRRSTDEQQ